MSADEILDLAGPIAPRAHWYMCGADSLKRELQSELEAMRVPVRQIHTEVFASQHAPAYRVAQSATASEPSDLFIADTGAAVDVEPGETLLAALERNGYRPESNCRAGICGACKLRMLEGEVDNQGEILSPGEKAEGYVLSCIAHPLGQVTLASGGRPPAGTVRRKVAGVSGGRSPFSVTGVRVATLVGASVMLAGAWSLTNHYPNSWAASAAPAAQQSTPATGTVGPTPASTSAVKSGGQGSAQPPAATATPKPKPKPAATSTPSPAH